MSSIPTDILILVLLLLINSLFVMSEMAVVSARKARLQQQANEGNKSAATALHLAQNPNTFLSTVQIGITLVSVLLGALGGPAFSEPLAELFKQWPALAPYADSLALAIVVVLITTLSLVLSELVPKRIALHDPEKIAAAISGPMLFISKLFSPLVWILGRLTDSILLLLGIQPSTDPPPADQSRHKGWRV